MKTKKTENKKIENKKTENRKNRKQEKPKTKKLKTKRKTKKNRKQKKTKTGKNFGKGWAHHQAPATSARYVRGTGTPELASAVASRGGRLRLCARGGASECGCVPESGRAGAGAAAGRLIRFLACGFGSSQPRSLVGGVVEGKPNLRKITFRAATSIFSIARCPDFDLLWVTSEKSPFAPLRRFFQ